MGITNNKKYLKCYIQIIAKQISDSVEYDRFHPDSPYRYFTDQKNSVHML